jgi:hypothetical protein
VTPAIVTGQVNGAVQLRASVMFDSVVFWLVFVTRKFCDPDVVLAGSVAELTTGVTVME